MRAGAQHIEQFVTGTVGDRLFALPIAHVRDVFVPDRITPVPRAPRDVVGLLYLRGRIVTAIDLRTRLGMPARAAVGGGMAIGIEYRNESYGLLVDTVGDVIGLDAESCEASPPNLSAAILDVAAGVHCLENRLMILLNIERVLSGAESGD